MIIIVTQSPGQLCAYPWSPWFLTSLTEPLSTGKATCFTLKWQADQSVLDDSLQMQNHKNNYDTRMVVLNLRIVAPLGVK